MLNCPHYPSSAYHVVLIWGKQSSSPASQYCFPACYHTYRHTKILAELVSRMISQCTYCFHEDCGCGSLRYTSILLHPATESGLCVNCCLYTSQQH